MREIGVGLKFDKTGKQSHNILVILGFIYYYDTNVDGTEHEYSTFGHLSEAQMVLKHKFCITMQYNLSKIQLSEIFDGSFDTTNYNYLSY